jgi:hypothetical protein
MRFHISARITPNVTITTHPRTASSISLAGIGAARLNKEGGLAIPGTAAKASHRRSAFELMVPNRPRDLLESSPGVLVLQLVSLETAVAQLHAQNFDAALLRCVHP